MFKLNKRRLFAIDCETDPFKHGRIPRPFIWGAYDGEEFFTLDKTEDMVTFLKTNACLAFAHNGGKFDFIYLLDHLNKGEINIINGRLVQAKLGKSVLRDSFAIMPTALSAYKKDEIDYSLFEAEVRQKYMTEIVSYLKGDCVYLYQMLDEYLRTAGTKTTIASNAMSFARKLDINVGRTNKIFDDKFRKYYFGGRCEAFKQGQFNDVNMYDINSAYPYAMVQNHASGDQYRMVQDPLNLDITRLQQCFLTITCFSNGAFPKRTKEGLTFPTGKHTFYVTGWEFVAAIKHNLLSELVIHDCYEFYDEINFADYILHWYTVKDQADKDGNDEKRYIAKIMLNSLYGKLCQDPEKYCDYIIVDAGTPCQDGWIYCWEYENLEVHRRDVTHKKKEKLGDKYDNAKQYYNVATGASITGFVRAMLIDAIHTIGDHNVIYCDTDSLFIMGSNKLRTGKELGDWTHDGFAEILHVAGKKLYAARGNFGKGKTEKIASKGSKLSFDEISKVASGGKVIWKNPAPTFKLNGTAKFVTRSITATGRAT